jgi:hypothetical protein
MDYILVIEREGDVHRKGICVTYLQVILHKPKEKLFDKFLIK